MADLTVHVVQQASDLDPAQNRKALDLVLDLPRDDAALVVLPEAFARDFGTPGSDVSPYAEPLEGPFVGRLSEVAAETGHTIVAGMFEPSDDPDRPYNTLVVVAPDGLVASYRKIHLYDSFGYRESDRLRAGEPEPVVVDVGGLPVGLMTCYDLRFPEMGRALVDRGAELFLVPAAWVAGERKVVHWRTLLQARAIENTVYVAAAAQPGPRYSGTSIVVAPNGEVLAELDETTEAVATAAVSSDLLQQTRAANPSLGNRRL